MHALIKPPCVGTDPSKPTLVAIKGTVFDVTGNASYAPETGPYRGMKPVQSLLAALLPFNLLATPVLPRTFTSPSLSPRVPLLHLTQPYRHRCV
jgi:hypothetical protein